MNNNGFGKQVKTLRAAKDMTLESLSNRTGIDRTWLSRIENGIVNPSQTQIDAIKAALEWDESIKAAVSLLAGEAPGPEACQ